MTAPDTLPGLRSRALQGVMLLGVQRAAGLLVATAGWLALARLLTPDAFGLYAIIAFAVGLGVAFGDLGFGAALIQRRDLDPTLCLSTVFLVHFTLATILGACLVGFSPFIVSWLSLPASAGELLQCLALLVPLSALKMPGVVLLERKVNYFPLAVADLLDTIMFYGVAVGAAWQGAGVWSFIIGAVAGRLVGLFTLLGAVRWRPRLSFRWETLGPILRFGLRYQGTSLLVLAREAAVPTYVASVCGVAAVGFLHWASTLALLPFQLVNLAGRVLFPTLAQLQDSPARLADATERALNRVAMVLYPAALLLLAGADPIVRFLYGSPWLPAVPAIRLFCVAVMLGGTWTILSFAINSLGRVDVTFRLNLFWTILLWGLTFMFVPWLGFIGYAVARACQGAVGAWTAVALKRLVPIRLFPAVRLPLFSGMVSAFLLWGLSLVWVHDLSSLIIAGIAAITTYILLTNWVGGARLKEDLLNDWRKAVEFRA